MVCDHFYLSPVEDSLIYLRHVSYFSSPEAYSWVNYNLEGMLLLNLRYLSRLY